MPLKRLEATATVRFCRKTNMIVANFIISILLSGDNKHPKITLSMADSQNNVIYMNELGTQIQYHTVTGHSMEQVYTVLYAHAALYYHLYLDWVSVCVQSHSFFRIFLHEKIFEYRQAILPLKFDVTIRMQECTVVLMMPSWQTVNWHYSTYCTNTFFVSSLHKALLFKI